jgi:hyperosmotically inducible protein
MKRLFVLLGILCLVWTPGCAPVLIGGGATAGYKVGTDERGVGRIWDDAAITTKIKTRMIEDSTVKARKIDVDTTNGNVVLVGVVKTNAEIQRALEIARGVPGVKSVRSSLQVGGKTIGQSMDDKVIVSKIKARLLSEPGIRSLNIDVDSAKGVVTLSGIVKTQVQKNRILTMAKENDGTVRVVDFIKVKYP